MELRCDPEAAEILAGYPLLKAATEEDWDTEYLAPILAVKVVADMDEAIEHINRHSSQHTESIITEDYTRAMRFLREVDSASVMVNASTRFADGFEYGLGAEIGISNDKLHARGPVGLEGLTSLKYVVLVLGVWLLAITWSFWKGPGNGWLHAKLFLVVLVIGYQHACGSLLKKFEHGKNVRSHVWYRWFNEVPVLLMLAIVILVVVKPF